MLCRELKALDMGVGYSVWYLARQMNLIWSSLLSTFKALFVVFVIKEKRLIIKQINSLMRRKERLTTRAVRLAVKLTSKSMAILNDLLYLLTRSFNRFASILFYIIIC